MRPSSTRYFPEGRAIGFTVELAGVAGITDPRQIVGVVANTQQQGLTSAAASDCVRAGAASAGSSFSAWYTVFSP